MAYNCNIKEEVLNAAIVVKASFMFFTDKQSKVFLLVCD